MAISSGFFNSVNGDRLYNADQMSNFYGGLIENGVVPGVKDMFKVSVTGKDLKITVGTGRAMINNKWIENDAPLTYDLSSLVSSVANCYAAVVVRLDVLGRDVSIQIRRSDPAASPIKPVPTRTDIIYELILAYIYLPQSISVVYSPWLEDMRSNADLCGYAHIEASVNGGKATVACDSSSRYYNIPSTLNYGPTDILNVYVNGLLINEIVNFTIMENEIEGGYQIQFGSILYSENDTLTFEVIKSNIE